MMARRKVFQMNKIVMKRKTVRMLFMLTLMTITMMMFPLSVMAKAVVNVVVNVVEETDRYSTVYAGEVILDGSSQLRYLYSDGITVNRVVFEELKEALKGTNFEGMVPDIANDTTAVHGFFRYTGTAQKGTEYKAETNYFGSISEDWSSAAAVAGRCFTGTVGTETKKDGSNFNSTLRVEYKGSKWEMRDGESVRVDTMVLHYENTTVVYTSVNVTTPKAVVKTAPTARALTCDGQAQELVTAGEAEGGTMQYALSEDAATAPNDSAYKTSVPTATNAGT